MPKAFTWDSRALRYRAPSGRFVKRSDVVKAFDRGVLANQRRAARIGRLAITDVRAWELAMREQIKLAHLQALALAKGGLSQITQADYGRLGAELKFHYKRLNRFARQLAARVVQPETAAFSRRVRAYFNAARTTFWSTMMRVHAAAGYLAENVLGAAEHCVASKRKPGVPSCTEETNRGAVPPESLSVPGTRVCVTGCACVIRFVRA